MKYLEAAIALSVSFACGFGVGRMIAVEPCTREHYVPVPCDHAIVEVEKKKGVVR